MISRNALRLVLSDVGEFTRLHKGYALRPYQVEAARMVAAAVMVPRSERAGDALVAVFSRQAGKDEMLAQLLAYLLLRHSRSGGSIVVAAPTQSPQANISRDRLVDRLRMNPLTKALVHVREGYEVHVGSAKASFLSAGPGSNARGQTASILLVANEAQDIEIPTWDAKFDPMGASTNAPTLFMGTVWSSTTLLDRQMAHARAQEAQDGRKRLYLADWSIVAQSIPEYGTRVRARMLQLGEAHPFIRTEYMLIPLDGDGGLFPAQRQIMLAGSHTRRHDPSPGERIAFLIDVAGSDEEETLGPGLDHRDPDSKRDSTVLTVVSIDTSMGEPRYLVLDRFAWLNVPWATVQGALEALRRRWSPLSVIVDATGIGFGMAVALKAQQAPGRVEFFTFTSKSKSDLGWQLVTMIDAGRVQEYEPDGRDDTTEHWRQLRHTEFEVLAGPGKLLRWSVPSAAGHDDSVLSFALVAELDRIRPLPRIAKGH